MNDLNNPRRYGRLKGKRASPDLLAELLGVPSTKRVSPTNPDHIARLLGARYPKPIAAKKPDLLGHLLGARRPKPAAPKRSGSVPHLLGVPGPKPLAPKPYGRPLVSSWAHVERHFEVFLSNLELTQSEQADALTKTKNIGRCLHAKYYRGEYVSRNLLIVGSYGKRTAIRPPSDIDILFVLPVFKYFRTDQLSGNGQSQLLQEVKRVLAETFPLTDLSADGQVVKVPFSSYNVEVVPAFRCNDGTYLTCHTANGGSWRASDPVAEYLAMANLDREYGNKATHLIKMLKAWKRAHNVPLKSIILEIAACSFLSQWTNSRQPMLWYDSMVRDCLAFLLKHRNGTAWIPGTRDEIPLGDLWVSLCRTAYSVAVKACEYERLNLALRAEDEWKRIFGFQFSSRHSRVGRRL